MEATDGQGAGRVGILQGLWMLGSYKLGIPVDRVLSLVVTRATAAGIARIVWES